MKLSAKSRYGLSAMIYLAHHYGSGTCITVIHMAESLTISKIYLEQIFSLLKRAGLVVSTKGSQGGYQLADEPKNISAYDILLSMENGLFEKTASTLKDTFLHLETALHQTIYDPIDDLLFQFLSNITLEDLKHASEKNKENGYMFYL